MKTRDETGFQALDVGQPGDIPRDPDRRAAVGLEDDEVSTLALDRSNISHHRSTNVTQLESGS